MSLKLTLTIEQEDQLKKIQKYIEDDGPWVYRSDEEGFIESHNTYGPGATLVARDITPSDGKFIVEMFNFIKGLKYDV